MECESRRAGMDAGRETAKETAKDKKIGLQSKIEHVNANYNAN